MGNDDLEITNDSLSEPAARALLAFLRHKEEPNADDVSDFLRDSPQFTAYQDVIQSYAEAASRLGLRNDAPPIDVDVSSVRNHNQSSAETIVFDPGTRNESHHGFPDGVAFKTVIRGIAVHAKGGLGVVCRGEDSILNREVAVKFIRPDHVSEATREIFALEAEITGRLDHPGVTPVLGIGETQEGRRFYVMRFLPGESLRDKIHQYHQHQEQDGSERAVDFRKMLTSFVSVCKTIGYAHSRGILHRDIKPHNIMLGSYGETIVVDWGLAIPFQSSHEHRVECDKTIIPESGGSSGSHPVAAGTLAYMPPEQALGESELTPATDIYALGATLYHLLCGRPPLQRSSERTFDIQSIIRGNYPRLRELRDEVSPDMEAICLKAMALKPENRYATALEMAEDVERFLADEPVSVHPDNVSRRIARWSRHHSTAIMTGAVSLILILLSAAAGLIVASVLYRVAEQQRARAEKLNETMLLQLAETAALRWSLDLSTRWGKLEHWADDPQLHQALRDVNATNDEDVLHAFDVQNWLRDRFNRGTASLEVTSWYANDRKGRVVARYDDSDPKQSQFHGQRFDFRSYFTGKPNDFCSDPLPPDSYPMLKQPHISAIYKSMGDDDAYRLALSVPVVSPAGEGLGVLTMTINLALLRDADLIDMRKNTFGGNYSLKGIYLRQAEEGDPESLKRVSVGLLRLVEAQDFSKPNSSSSMLVPNYSSSLDPPSTATRKAAIAPIKVEGEYTELVVVVEQGDSAD